MKINEPKEKWGGAWTEKKLDAFVKYVRSYLTIMRKYPYWKTIYFDGFAGSGKRNINAELASQLAILPEEEQVYQGAAERLIEMKDFSFDFYYFIDQEQESLNKLKEHLNEIDRTQEKRKEFRVGDCNKYLLELSNALKNKSNSYSALVFLDPFGMQIDWESIESLRGTRTDIWILVPTGMVINRLLDRKGELRNIKKLESFFGLEESAIREHFYHVQTVPTLFGQHEIISKILDPIEKISSLYVERLKTIWDHVTPKPLRLLNSNKVPIFHFVLASNNKTGVKIANEIIDKI